MIYIRFQSSESELAQICERERRCGENLLESDQRGSLLGPDEHDRKTTMCDSAREVGQMFG